MNLYLIKLIRHFALSVLILSFGLLATSVASADTGSNSTNRTDATKACQPFNIPMAGVPCDAGYTGTKYPMRTKECPSGKITDGLTFDYSNCKQVGKGQVDVNATDCSITPNVVGCMAAPTLSGCSIGKHWTLKGTNIAHCVSDDPACAWGTSLTHDSKGEPSCVQNTCPGNQVLQADGISCACPPSLPVWNGNSCEAPCIGTTAQITADCPSGQTGSRTLDLVFDCNSKVISKTEISNTCVSTPVTCPAETTYISACPPPMTGSMKVTRYYNLTNGVSCLPSEVNDESGCSSVPVTPSCPPGGPQKNWPNCTCDSNETWNGSTCISNNSSSSQSSATLPVTCPDARVTSRSCPIGFDGNIFVTTTYFGPSCSETNTEQNACVPSARNGSSTGPAWDTWVPEVVCVPVTRQNADGSWSTRLVYPWDTGVTDMGNSPTCTPSPGYYQHWKLDANGNPVLLN